jgi:hypothetical protein
MIVLKITFSGKCKICGASIEITDNQDDESSIYKSKLTCPICGSEFSSPSIERLSRIASKIHSCALFVDPLQLNSITLTSNPEDPERLRARQSEYDFHQERLKELEAEFGDRD